MVRELIKVADGCSRNPEDALLLLFQIELATINFCYLYIL